MALVCTLYDFFYFPVFGMAYGVQSVISYNIGASQWDRVNATVKLLLRSTLVWSVLVWIVMLAIPEPVVRLVLKNYR
jgi:Na+-driven multidrug efflux pump